MAYCSKCRRYVRAEFIEFIQNSAWCPHCDTLVGVSLCKVPAWVLGIVLTLSVAALNFG